MDAFSRAIRLGMIAALSGACNPEPQSYSPVFVPAEMMTAPVAAGRVDAGADLALAGDGGAPTPASTSTTKRARVARHEPGTRDCCQGKNECKGQSGCAVNAKSSCSGAGAAGHSCAGKNDCKGSGTSCPPNTNNP